MPLNYIVLLLVLVMMALRCVVLCCVVWWQLRRSLEWEHEGTRQLIASEVLARTAKHVLACRLSLSRDSTEIEDEVRVCHKVTESYFFSYSTDKVGGAAEDKADRGAQGKNKQEWGGVP